MRAFFAIELPDDVRAELALAQRRLREALEDAPIGWTPPANWHLTLAFLGDIADPAPWADAARAALAGVGPIDLAIGALGTFGDRVLWAGVSGPGLPALVALADALGQALAPLGYAAEHRPYSPHITLGRTREGPRGRGKRTPRGRRGTAGGVVEVVRAAPAPAPLAFTAREVVLFESKLGGPHPATYVAQAHVPLAAPR